MTVCSALLFYQLIYWTRDASLQMSERKNLTFQEFFRPAIGENAEEACFLG